MSTRKIRWRERRPRGRRTPFVSLLALLAIVVAAAVAWFSLAQPDTPPAAAPPAAVPAAPPPAAATPSARADQVLSAFHAHRSNVEVETSARVIRVLKDDNDGSRHERFLILVADTLTVLVAHNIDIAPPIPLLAGDSVQLRGEYIWDARGGVIHWTHRDTRGKREGGWVRHEGTVYR